MKVIDLSLRIVAMLVLCALLDRPSHAQYYIPQGVDETFPITQMDPVNVVLDHSSVRYSYREFEVTDVGRARERVHVVVTVLSKEDEELADMQVFYDGLRDLKSFKGRVRDPLGKVTYEMHKDDWRDFSAISDYTLYEDSRVRFAQLRGDSYPFTVEYWYELNHKGIANWPIWYPQTSVAPVERAILTIKAPSGTPVRHLALGTDIEPTVTNGKEIQYTWDLQGIPYFDREPWGPGSFDQKISVYTATSLFEVEGTEGDMSSWQTFGQWYGRLSEGRDELPPATVAELQSIVKGADTDIEKARRLYRRLQEKTRYVNVNLGIGGWQTYPAIYVDERGYGDCKALTNYMYSMLKAVGVEAYPALIRNGGYIPPVLDQFPCNQFNHVILYLPNGDSEPIWLECTSQTIPFGHISASNEDRPALVIKPTGGELIRTPKSGSDANRQIRTAIVQLDGAGDATVDLSAAYTGNQQDRVRGPLISASGKEREEWVHEELEIGSGELISLETRGVESNLDSLSLEARFVSKRVGKRNGKRMFVRPTFLEQWASIPPEVEKRTQPVVFDYAFADDDSLVFRLPMDYEIEVLPDPISIDKPFARYRLAATKLDDGSVAFRRSLEIRDSRIAAEAYDDVRGFFQQVVRAERNQFVLVSK